MESVAVRKVSASQVVEVQKEKPVFQPSSSENACGSPVLSSDRRALLLSTYKWKFLRRWNWQ